MRNQKILDLAVRVNDLIYKHFENNFSENNFSKGRLGSCSFVAKYSDDSNNYNWITLTQNVSEDNIVIIISGFNANINDSISLILRFDLKTGKLNYTREGYLLKNKISVSNLFGYFFDTVINI